MLMTEPAPLDRRRLWVVFGGLMLATALGALDQAIVATALPVIVTDLGGIEHLSWVVTSYLLASTASTPLWGKIGDLVGRKSTFLVAIAIFVVGSVLCAVSQTMLQLIAARAVQGVGGGGLLVTSQAVIGDIVSPRERGRYQGIFGAVFAFSSVVGPILGGLVVDAFSWHWVFLINLPIGAAAFVVIALALPAGQRRSEHRIDYLGAVLITSATTCFVLVMTLGGVAYAWLSPLMLGLGAAGVACTAAFVAVEHRAAEPILPLALFRIPAFRVSSALSFLIGGALLGPVTILPLFLQTVNRLSPTESGMRMLALLLAVPVASITTGQVISRTGRYRMFPIAGTACIAIGLFSMSRITESTSAQSMSISMAVLGLGLGMTMQVLVLAVQNAAPYQHLGAATSGVTFFRSMGSVFGVALFGAIFTGRLAAGPGDPEAAAYVAALEAVFLAASPFGVAGFALALMLEEVPLRSSASAERTESPITPALASQSSDEIERILGRMVSREGRRAVYEELASPAGVSLAPIGCWLLFRIDEFSPSSIAALADRLPLSRADLQARVAWLGDLGLVSLRIDDQDASSTDPTVTLTSEGRGVVDKLSRARAERLERLLQAWHPEQHPEFEELLRRLARVLVPDVTAAEVMPGVSSTGGPPRQHA
jgi:EmrB/QacA subfamily drug resistance transporter